MRRGGFGIGTEKEAQSGRNKKKCGCPVPRVHVVEVEVVIATPQLKPPESTAVHCKTIIVALSGAFSISSLLARRVMYSMPWRMDGRDIPPGAPIQYYHVNLSLFDAIQQ